MFKSSEMFVYRRMFVVLTHLSNVLLKLMTSKLGINSAMSEKFITLGNSEVLYFFIKISKSKKQNAGQLGVRIVKRGLINV